MMELKNAFDFSISYSVFFFVSLPLSTAGEGEGWRGHLLGACCFRKGRLSNKLMMLKAYQALKQSGLQHHEDDFFYFIPFPDK